MHTFAFLLLVAHSALAQPMVEFPLELRDSTDMQALLTFADSAESAGAYDLASQALERALTLQADNQTLAIRAAENAYRTGPAGKAASMEHAAALIAASPPADIAARAHLLRGLLLFEQEQYEGAGLDFQAALKFAPDNVRAGVGQAATDAALGRFAPASVRFDEMGSAAQPYDVETRYMLRAALLHVQASRTPLPQDAAGTEALGKILYRAARFPDAIRTLRKAADSYGDNVNTWNLLAAIAAQAGDLAQARAAAEASLRLNPDQPEIAQMLQALSAANPQGTPPAPTAE